MLVLIYLCQSYCTCTESGTASYIDPISGANVTVNMYSVAVCLNLPRDLNSQYLLSQSDPSAQADSMDFSNSRLRSMGDFFTNYPLLQDINLDRNTDLVFDNKTFDGLTNLVSISASSIGYNGLTNINLEFMNKLERVIISSTLPESFDFNNHPNLKYLSVNGMKSSDFKNICTGVKDSLEGMTISGNVSDPVLARPFENDCFANFTKLETCTISYLDIEGTGLMNSRALTYVSLLSTNAGPEEFHALYSLPNLVTLTLVNATYSGRPLTEMPFEDEFITIARNLTSFTLSLSPITELPPFPPNSSISNIVVGDTLLSSISLSQLSELPNLTQASFSNNNISIVEALDPLPFINGSCGGIQSTSPLQILDFSSNVYIHDFPSNVGCWFPRLQRLNAANASIGVVYINGNFTELDGLSLSRNNITEIQFLDNSTITYTVAASLLDIHGNSLESLPLNIFGIQGVEPSNSLNLFNASDNFLGRRVDPFMGALCHIMQMDFTNNHISDLSPFLKLSPNASYIDASRNNLSYVSVDIGANPSAGLVLVLDHNRFNRCDDIVVTPEKFLKTISVSKNAIPRLNASCFGKNGMHLGVATMNIDFSHNVLSHIDSYTFSNLAALRTIELSGNRLDIISANTVFNCSNDGAFGVEFHASHNVLKTFDPLSVFSGGSFFSKLYLDYNQLSEFPRYNASLKNFDDTLSPDPTLISLTGNTNLTFTVADCPLGIDVNALAPQYVQILDMGSTGVSSDTLDTVLSCSAFSWFFLEENKLEYFSTFSPSYAYIYSLLFRGNSLMKGLPHNFMKIFPKLYFVSLPDFPCENIGMDNMDLMRNQTLSVVDKKVLVNSVFSVQNANGDTISAPIYYSKLSDMSDVESNYCLLNGEKVSFSDAYDYYTSNNVSFICQDSLSQMNVSKNIVPVVCASEGGQCISSGNGRDYCTCESDYEGDGYVCLSTGFKNVSRVFNGTILVCMIASFLGIYIFASLVAFLLLTSIGT
eukprot:Nk52_evm54s2531 gene=Nk52_evmTU54s2531